MTLRTLRKPFSDDRIRRSVFRILRENVLCSISTVAPGNRAHINTAYFCYTPHLLVYFLSDPGPPALSEPPAKPVSRDDDFQVRTGVGRSRSRGPAVRDMRANTRPYRAGGGTVLRREVRTVQKMDGGHEPCGRAQAALLRSYAFYRFLPSRVKILDEREFGGAVFVTAAVMRGPRSGAVLRWSASERLSP
jgi:hypothetical protein